MNHSSQSLFGFHSRFSFGSVGFGVPSNRSGQEIRVLVWGYVKTDQFGSTGSVSVRSTLVKPVRFMFVFKAQAILRFSSVQFVSIQSTALNSVNSGQLPVNSVNFNGKLGKLLNKASFV
ncbi:hypothetical protein Hanom_Chr11g01015661 [Helianthus anomalus]